MLWTQASFVPSTLAYHTDGWHFQKPHSSKINSSVFWATANSYIERILSQTLNNDLFEVSAKFLLGCRRVASKRKALWKGRDPMYNCWSEENPFHLKVHSLFVLHSSPSYTQTLKVQGAKPQGIKSRVRLGREKQTSLRNSGNGLRRYFYSHWLVEIIWVICQLSVYFSLIKFNDFLSFKIFTAGCGVLSTGNPISSARSRRYDASGFLIYTCVSSAGRPRRLYVQQEKIRFVWEETVGNRNEFLIKR